VPVFLATLGISEMFGGLLIMVAARSVHQEIAGILLFGFAGLTFGLAAVIY
jgi:hypothetical protein